jgi:hypothetical protein
MAEPASCCKGVNQGGYAVLSDMFDRFYSRLSAVSDEATGVRACVRACVRAWCVDPQTERNVARKAKPPSLTTICSCIVATAQNILLLTWPQNDHADCGGRG